MGNICSTYLRIYPKERMSNQVEEFQFYKIARDLMESTWGYPYCTPLFMSFGPMGSYLEVAFGEKWSPSGMRNVFENLKDKIDAIFYRYYDSGGDYDAIHCLSNNELLDAIYDPHKIELCKYGFDEIRFHSAVGIDHPLVSHINGNLYRASIQGDYLSFSDYTDLLRSGFGEYRIDDSSMARTDEMKINCDESELLNAIAAQAVQMEYNYHGKLVTYCIDSDEYLRRGYTSRERAGERHWMRFPFDRWHNCIDPVYLQYIREINTQTMHLK